MRIKIHVHTKTIKSTVTLFIERYPTRMAMPSFAITLYDQYCQRHVVGQRVVSDISVVRSCGSIRSMYSESNSASLLLRLLSAVLGTSFLLHIINI